MGMQGDFFQLLKEQGYQFGTSPIGPGGQTMPESEITRGTTILAMKYHDGVLVAGDRRATAGNMVMYDRTDKVLELDRYSVMAIAGFKRQPTKWLVSSSIPSNIIGARNSRN